MTILAILDHIGGDRAQKSPKMGYFVDAEAVRKTLDIFNLATAIAILMKLTTIIYLQESVNQKALRVRNSFFWLYLIASLVKLLYKLDIWGSILRKTTQNRFKMIATITSLKLEPKPLSSRVTKHCKTFHLEQNLRRNQRASEGVALKPYETGLQKTVFCPDFRHLLRRLKNCKIYHVLH